MKLAKSLLLGSVAGLAAVAGANAADLPAKKAAPVEYVRVCSTYGAGFFYIPGTETCVRVGGRVRAEYLYSEPLSRADNSIGFRARGRLNVDVRTATAYGLLRTFVRYEITRNTGSYVGGSQGAVRTSGDIAEAFVQFGGLTAGRVTSFFDNGDLPTEHWGTLRFSDAPDVNLLAYTFSFGNGFSASLALEEGRYAGNLQPAAGQRVPDVVANVKYTGTWGSAQLSGAVHQIRSGVLSAAGTPVALVGTIPSTEYGWTVSGQVGVNLPMLAPGDALWFAATYANGALGYLGFDSTNTVGTVTADVVDAYVGPDGDLRKGTGWSLAGGLTHYWAPQVRQSVFGSYARVNYGATATAADFNEWRVGSNVIWQPVSGLDIGVEVLYASQDPRGALRSDHAWEGRLRVQRDF